MKNYNFNYPIRNSELFLQIVMNIQYFLWLSSLYMLIFYGISDISLTYFICSSISLLVSFHFHKVSINESIDSYIKWIAIEASKNDSLQEIECFVNNDTDKLSAKIIKKALGRGNFRLSNKDAFVFSLLYLPPLLRMRFYQKGA